MSLLNFLNGYYVRKYVSMADGIFIENLEIGQSIAEGISVVCFDNDKSGNGKRCMCLGYKTNEKRYKRLRHYD